MEKSSGREGYIIIRDMIPDVVISAVCCISYWSDMQSLFTMLIKEKEITYSLVYFSLYCILYRLRQRSTVIRLKPGRQEGTVGGAGYCSCAGLTVEELLQ